MDVSSTPYAPRATTHPPCLHLRKVRQKHQFRLTFILLLAALLTSPLLADPSTPTDSQPIISFLNQTIVWYHQLTSQQQLATEPSDVLFLNDNRQIADDILRLSFEFARAQAQTLTRETQAATPSSENAGNRYQSLNALALQADNQAKSLQNEIDNLRRQLESAKPKQRRELDAALTETQSELQLAQARRDILSSMLSFLAGAGVAGGGTLQQQIDELARTVPAANAPATTATTAKPEQSAKPQAAAAENTTRAAGLSSIYGLASDLIALHRKSLALKQAAATSVQLAQTSRQMMSPLVAQAKQLTAQGDQLSAQPDSTDPQVLTQQKKQVDALTAQFKQASAAILPLGKQQVLLDIYKRNLENWRTSVQTQYESELKSLILRLVILGIILGLIAGISEVWRKATFRYVHDTRRRYQILLLRRIAIWIIVGLVVAAAFSSELGTLATFAGLLTAGIAVALQNVILSVAGYFFLIGKYGVRVGDRVQIAGVTGDVIDIGLVRLHIMEVGGGGTDARATGRVVVFSNAVVFQPNSGLFKQIPGTNFVWHAITLTLAADSNYHLVEKRLMDAVNSVYAEYKESLEAQRRRMEQNLSGISVRPLEPESRLHLTQAGLEVVIRFPVDLGNPAQIDDDMTRALLDAIAREPRLRLVGTGTPNIQSVSDEKAA